MWLFDGKRAGWRLLDEYSTCASTRWVFLAVASPPLLILLHRRLTGGRTSPEEWALVAGTILAFQALFLGYKVKVFDRGVSYRDLYSRWRTIEWADVVRATYGQAPEKRSPSWYDLNLYGNSTYRRRPLSINTKPFDFLMYRRLAGALRQYAPQAGLDKDLKRTSPLDAAPPRRDRQRVALDLICMLLSMLVVAVVLRNLLW